MVCYLWYIVGAMFKFDDNRRSLQSEFCVFVSKIKLLITY